MSFMLDYLHLKEKSSEDIKGKGLSEENKRGGVVEEGPSDMSYAFVLIDATKTP
ncbi:MAG: hypothetical protein Q8Q56_00085 [Alphaproteobacteria bacterium]|nr:hypothetical protein [Alphaproteobacteria bacterium]